MLVGIFALLQMQNLPRNSTQVLLRNMFLHIQAETCIPPDRLQIYKILEIALKTKDSGKNFNHKTFFLSYLITAIMCL